MNSYSKLSISVLFTIALSTGFLSVAFVQRAHAFSIDFSGLPGFGDDYGLNILQGTSGLEIEFDAKIYFTLGPLFIL